MPTYQYKCPKCPMTITILRGVKEEEHKPICINCASKMERVYESVAVSFKGEGWAGKE